MFRFVLNHVLGEFFKDAGFIFAVGVTRFAGQAGGVLRGVFTVVAAIIIEDGLAHFIVDGRAPAFVERVPNTQAIGGQTADVRRVIDEQDGEVFASGAHGAGDAGGVAAVNDEIVVLLRHWIPLGSFRYSGWD